MYYLLIFYIKRGVRHFSAISQTFSLFLCQCAFAAIFLFCGPCVFVASAAQSAVSFTDDAGVAIHLPAPAVRIVSLYAGLSESLRALGASECIIARTLSDNAAPPGTPEIGTHMRPNVEMITALQPDIVLQFEGREEAAFTANMLEKQGITVARFRIRSYKDMFRTLVTLGEITGRKNAANELVASLQKRLDAVKEKRAQKRNGAALPTVFFEVRYPNLLAAGSGNMVEDIIEAAGAKNILASYPQRMVRLNEETLVALNPDVYIVQQGPMNKNASSPETRAHFTGLSAIRNKHTVTVDEALFSRPGPNSVDAAELLADILFGWGL